jgi:hypothetical protein
MAPARAILWACCSRDARGDRARSFAANCSMEGAYASSIATTRRSLPIILSIEIQRSPAKQCRVETAVVCLISWLRRRPRLGRAQPPSRVEGVMQPLFPPNKPLPIASLVPYALNARTHNDAQVAQAWISAKKNVVERRIVALRNMILVDYNVRASRGCIDWIPLSPQPRESGANPSGTAHLNRHDPRKKSRSRTETSGWARRR